MDLYVMHEQYYDGESWEYDTVIAGRDNALKVAENRWKLLLDGDVDNPHVAVFPAIINDCGIIVAKSFSDPVFIRG